MFKLLANSIAMRLNRVNVQTSGTLYSDELNRVNVQTSGTLYSDELNRVNVQTSGKQYSDEIKQGKCSNFWHTV